MPESLISVVMVCGAESRFLRGAVESVLAQTHRQIELLLAPAEVNWSAPDWLAALNDSRVRVLAASRDKVEALNLAAGESRGKYIARLEADDISFPSRFEKQAAFLDAHPQAGLLLTSYEKINAEGATIAFRDVSADEEGLQIELATADRLCKGVAMFRRELFERAGGCDPASAPAEEYDLWLRLAEVAPIASLREYLYQARVCGEPAANTEAAERAQNAALRRRCWLRRLGRSKALLAWARAATRVGKPVAAAALLAKSVAANPLSGGPWRLAFSRMAWAINGTLGRGKAGAIRNETLVRREIERGETVLRSHPSQLMLLMIDACNSKCVMCGGEYFAHRSGRALTLAKVEKIFNHLRPQFLTMAIFAGGGEPLLNPQFDEIAALSRARCPTATLTVITNGIALDEKRIATLVRHRINALVSINAANAETYRRIHQVDQFERVRENVRSLARAAKDAGSPMDITLSLVGTRRNVAELPDLVRIAQDCGANGVLMSYCRFFPECFRCKSFDAAQNRLRDEDSLVFHRELSDRCVVASRRLAAELGVRLEHERLFAAGDTAGHCGYPWTTVFASYDGEVYWCPTGEVLFEGAVETGRYSTGNLVRQDIREIRNNDFFVGLRKSALSEEATVAECRVCGNRLEWLGPCDPTRHILAWDPSWKGAPRSGGAA